MSFAEDLEEYNAWKEWWVNTDDLPLRYDNWLWVLKRSEVLSDIETAFWKFKDRTLNESGGEEFLDLLNQILEGLENLED